ncbi:MAG: UxaA family hydrolase [Rhodoferax sp.]|nr:UxaA family hydrolase [Rhodoferax sp.]MCB2003954.1 UxaA family hydrolase [Rhodoferax sp.]MCB2031238.1 UxaA family hydrolase [Rhodoferax sp.]MCB2039610.1 UxaA family hydrolase [Rhodoferax sp.]MCW5627874.1 UxaA family hydrolase [Rhodoferax sp.]
MTPSDGVRVLVVDARDNVATCLAALKAGDTVALERAGATRSIGLATDVPFGHKFALEPIDAGGEIRKYGVVVAQATRAIDAGEHVHVHNVESRRGRGDRA